MAHEGLDGRDHRRMNFCQYAMDMTRVLNGQAEVVTESAAPAFKNGRAALARSLRVLGDRACGMQVGEGA